MSEPKEQNRTPYPRETLRLLFRFDKDSVELVSQHREEMIAPPSFGEPPEGGKNSGAWVEVLDSQGRKVAYRVLHDPFQTHADHHSPDGRIEHYERPAGSGEFEVLLPALPEAATVSLWSSPTEPGLAAEAAREIARFDLNREPDGGKEVAT